MVFQVKSYRFLFNAAQPGVDCVQVLGSKKTEEEEPLLALISKCTLEVCGGANRSLGVLSMGMTTNLESRGPDRGSPDLKI